MTAHDSSVVRPASAMPWGQLLVGGAIGGFAIWMGALNATGGAPSPSLAGVAAAYETARDAAMAPLQLLHIDLSPAYKDGLAFVVVMFAAMIRTALRDPDYWWAPIGVLLVGVCWHAIIVWGLTWGTQPTVTYFAEQTIMEMAVFVVFITLIGPFAGFIGRAMEPVRDLDEMTSPGAMATLGHAVAIALIAGGLSVFNWATGAP